MCGAPFMVIKALKRFFSDIGTWHGLVFSLPRNQGKKRRSNDYIGLLEFRLAPCDEGSNDA
ncbi:hypothetical protein K7432_013064 [Basidiobolus ranarum]|uniref:Uncharacterized protein n=1 Tax=Basidiobolus ranarum TaxID=34480 RepID=A0ABR2WJT7_9FUNG